MRITRPPLVLAVLDVKTLMYQRFRSALWVLSCVLVACAGSRCDASKEAGHAAQVQKTPRPDLRLLLLTDPRGYLEPCGCQVRPLGGLDKLATVVADARREGIPTLTLAAGNIAFGTELRPEDAEEARTQELYRAETFAESYKRIGLGAVTPGPLDLAQSEELVGKLVKLGGFPWIVDNVSGETGGHAPFTSGQVIDAGGVKVGVLGLSAADAPAAPKSSFALGADLAEVAKVKSAALRAQGAQFVIALVSADRRTARTIAGRGVDVVVMGGLDLERALPPAIAGEAVLLHAGQQGQHVLQIDVGLKGKGAWEDASEWTRREAKKELEQQIRELSERVRAWEKDQKVASRDLDAQRARLRDLEQQRATDTTLTFAGRWFRADLKELAPEVPGERSIAALLDTHDKRVNEHNRVTLAERKPPPAAEGSASYVGSASCGTANCHKQAYDWWRSTKHGNAYATLEKKHKEFNLNCVSCHVTGYNQPGGSTVTHLGGTGELKDVGCESCHGPGSLHNADPERAGLVARAVPEASCTSCHTHEHSDRFVYDSFRAMLIVPGHGKAGDRQ